MFDSKKKTNTVKSKKEQSKTQPKNEEIAQGLLDAFHELYGEVEELLPFRENRKVSYVFPPEDDSGEQNPGKTSKYTLEKHVAESESHTSQNDSPTVIKRLNDPSIIRTIKRLFSKGQPLPKNVATEFEQDFGDVSHVLIHTYKRAQYLCESLNAEAFAYENHIFFNKGTYDPVTDKGKELLAHELTHVVQQNGQFLSSIQRKVRVQNLDRELNLSFLGWVILRELDAGEDILFESEDALESHVQKTIDDSMNEINGRINKYNKLSTKQILEGFFGTDYDTTIKEFKQVNDLPDEDLNAWIKTCIIFFDWIPGRPIRSIEKPEILIYETANGPLIYGKTSDDAWNLARKAGYYIGGTFDHLNHKGESSLSYRKYAGLSLTEDLTEQQKQFTYWAQTRTLFKEVNSHLNDAELDRFIKVWLMRGWSYEGFSRKPEKFPIPNIKQNYYYYVNYKKPEQRLDQSGKKIAFTQDEKELSGVFTVYGQGQDVLSVLVYENDHELDGRSALLNDLQFKGLFLWVNPTNGKKGVIGYPESVKIFNKRWSLHLDLVMSQMSVFLQSKRDLAKVKDILSIQSPWDMFAAFAKAVQKHLDVPATGMFSQEHYDQMIVDIQQVQLLDAREASASYQDFIKDRKKFIARLYFVTGSQELYKSAMYEYKKNPSTQQLGPSSSDASKQDPKLYNLANMIQHAQELLGHSKINGQMDIKTAQLMDDFGLKFSEGGHMVMDKWRLNRTIAIEQSKEPKLHWANDKFKEFEQQVNELSDQLAKERKLGRGQEPETFNKYLEAQRKYEKARAILYRVNPSIIGKKFDDYTTNWYAGNTDEMFLPTSNPFVTNEEDFEQVNAENQQRNLYDPVVLPKLNLADFGSNYVTMTDKMLNRGSGQTIDTRIAQMEEQILYYRALMFEEAKKQGLPVNAYLNQYYELLKYPEFIKESTNVYDTFSFGYAGIDLLEQEKAFEFNQKDAFAAESTGVANQGYFNNSKYNLRTFKEGNKWKKKAFQSLLQTPSPEQGLLGDLYSFLQLFKNSARVYYIQGLKDNGTYSKKELIRIAVQFIDEEVKYQLTGRGNTKVHQQFSGIQSQISFLKEKRNEHGNKATIIPAYFKYKQKISTRQGTRSVQHLQSSLRGVPNQYLNYITTGIWLNLFLTSDDNNYYLHLKMGDGNHKKMYTQSKTKFGKRGTTPGKYTQSEALDKLIETLNSDNGLPPGLLTYMKPDGQLVKDKEMEDNWQWSDILAWTAIALMVAGAFFTGGATLAGMPLLTALSVGTFIASELVHMAELDRSGNLKGGDVALGIFNIATSIIPLARAGKLAKIAKSPFKFLNNKYFVGTTIAADFTVNGYILTDQIMTNLASLDHLEGKERDRAARKIIMTGMLFGLIQAHSLKADLNDLSKLSGVNKGFAFTNKSTGKVEKATLDESFLRKHADPNIKPAKQVIGSNMQAPKSTKQLPEKTPSGSNKTIAPIKQERVIQDSLPFKPAKKLSPLEQKQVQSHSKQLDNEITALGDELNKIKKRQAKAAQAPAYSFVEPFTPLIIRPLFKAVRNFIDQRKIAGLQSKITKANFEKELVKSGKIAVDDLQRLRPAIDQVWDDVHFKGMSTKEKQQVMQYRSKNFETDLTNKEILETLNPKGNATNKNVEIPEQNVAQKKIDENKSVDDLIGKNVNDLTEAPEGYTFYRKKDGSKGLKRKNINDPKTPDVLSTDSNGIISKGIAKTKPDWYETASPAGQKAYDNRHKLRQNLDTPEGQQAHHPTSIELVGSNKTVQDAVDRGYDMNKTGVNLEPYSSKNPKFDASGNPISQGTHASHPNYTQEVSKLHDVFREEFKGNRYKPELWLDLFNKNLSKKLDNISGPGKTIKVDDVFNNHINPKALYKEVRKEYIKALKK